ncbi:hypothetical protein Ahy_B01g053849 [Arachis hypogaea]|uniref:Uncharacterized protein n=1 Tax=Arachis hypogaea TaxID=3818 RepID=A0A445ASS2_ARAHY|nr:hypothetical protein Ahy_B01g053849 [Arachis hypogaea]
MVVSSEFDPSLVLSHKFSDTSHSYTERVAATSSTRNLELLKSFEASLAIDYTKDLILQLQLKLELEV